ncbi:hypothetical protein MACH10_31210 [Thalassospira tepidiphila]|uniref:GNAT family N-acetyltransferase n=1 Tax=Thalassospira tepidiphila TaxID=393657 RepID=UPI002925E1A0|nr:hypothetical protein MACH10_31210 [Thalassospira tepidiphila]
MFQIVPRNECDRTAWNAAADCFPAAWAWHRSELLDARATWSRTEDLSFCICDPSNGHKIVALVPLVLVRPRSLSLFLGSHFESTGAPAIDPSLPRRSVRKVHEFIYDAIVSLANDNRARRTDFSVAPLSPEVRSIDRPFPNPLCQFGAKDTSTQSWVLKISDQGGEEKLWEGLEYRSRKQISKAKRAELVADIKIPNSSLLETYYDLHLLTCTRNGILPHPKAYFKAIFENPDGQKMCTTVVVRNGHTVLTIQNFLIYKDAAIYWTVASSDDALKLCANDFGMWTAIRHFHAKGLEYLECGEAFPAADTGKQRGLNDFKKSFGGQLFPYYRGAIYHKPLFEGLLGMLRHCRKRGAAT